ncbi:hypothetical protein ACMFMF_011892 [Clarireedia jacksonii]
MATEKPTKAPTSKPTAPGTMSQALELSQLFRLTETVLADLQAYLPCFQSLDNPTIQLLTTYTYQLSDFTEWLHKGDFTKSPEYQNDNFNPNPKPGKLHREEANILAVACKLLEDVEKEISKKKRPHYVNEKLINEINRIMGLFYEVKRDVEREIGDKGLRQNASLDDLAEVASHAGPLPDGEKKPDGANTQGAPSESVGEIPDFASVSRRATPKPATPKRRGRPKAVAKRSSSARPPVADQTQREASQVATTSRQRKAQKLPPGPIPRRAPFKKPLPNHPVKSSLSSGSQLGPTVPSQPSTSASSAASIHPHRSQTQPLGPDDTSTVTPQRPLPPYETIFAPQPNRAISNNPSLMQGRIIPTSPDTPYHSAPRSALLYSFPYAPNNASQTFTGDVLHSHRYPQPAPTNLQRISSTNAEVQSAPGNLQNTGRGQLIHHHLVHYHHHHHHYYHPQSFPHPNQHIPPPNASRSAQSAPNPQQSNSSRPSPAQAHPPPSNRSLHYEKLPAESTFAEAATNSGPGRSSMGMGNQSDSPTAPYRMPAPVRRGRGRGSSM